ncbi:MAG: VWA domain-containing protein [Acidobacteriaceae bacterium]|jgi:Ca-activated chloride channel family protein
MTLARLIPLPLLALLTTLPPALAQTPAATPAPPPPTPISADTPTLKVNSTIVAVSAIVHDANGQPVSGLTRNDFVLKQDGKPQPITYFSQGSSLPITLALMVDTSGSQRNYIQDEVAAGRAFFPAMLTRPDDRAVLIQFDSAILQLVKITSNTTTLEHGLAYLTQSHSDYASPGHGGTLLYDAVIAVSHLELGNQLGRRAMVILTDGGDNGSHFNAKDAIREAQRADTIIYTIYYSNGGGDEGVLKDLSKATGGREFSVSSTMTLQQIYATIAADLRLQYELGYRPPDSRPNKYHKIDLAAKDKTLTVQAREGYFTPK